MLLRLIIGGQVSLVEDDVPEYEEHDWNRVLSVAQDFVYCVSGGKTKIYLKTTSMLCVRLHVC